MCLPASEPLSPGRAELIVGLFFPDLGNFIIRHEKSPVVARRRDVSEER